MVESKDIAIQLISIIVSTTPTQLEEDPIVVRTLVDPVTSDSNHVVLHVDVTQGSRPVTGLNVTAKVELPSGGTETIKLYDNGAGMLISNTCIRFEGSIQYGTFLIQ